MFDEKYYLKTIYKRNIEKTGFCGFKTAIKSSLFLFVNSRSPPFFQSIKKYSIGGKKDGNAKKK